MLERKLAGSSFSEPEIIQTIVDAFERQVRSQLDAESTPDYALEVKPKFNGVIDEYSLKFGTSRDNDARLGIKKGRITLSTEDLKPVFDPIVDKIATSCSSAIVSQKAEVM